jgi:hypothetical protein
MTTQLNCTVATPPGFVSGTWELTPFQPYTVGTGPSAVTVTGPFRGDITSAGLLVGKGVTTPAQVNVPATGGYDAGQGVLTTNFKTTTATLPGRPMTLPLVETTAGAMDVAFLLSSGRAQVLTPQQAVDFAALTTQGFSARDAAIAAAGTVAAAVAAIPGQVATGLAPVAPALASMAQSLADNAQLAAQLGALPTAVKGLRVDTPITGDYGGTFWSFTQDSSALTAATVSAGTNGGLLYDLTGGI